MFVLIQIRECTLDDVAQLANMNQLLIEDEHAQNTMSLPQLEERMSTFLSSSYKAFFLLWENAIVGYALFDMSKTPLYLRQFFICREERRKGYGKQAFHALRIFLNTNNIDIDVYAWNKTGIAFWQSLGFETRCFAMRYKKQ